LRDILETCAPAAWEGAVEKAKLGPVLVKAIPIVYGHCPLAGATTIGAGIGTDSGVVRQAKTFHEKMAVALLGQLTQTLGDLQTQAVNTCAGCNSGGFVYGCLRSLLLHVRPLFPSLPSIDW
jgi:hypothetical protein